MESKLSSVSKSLTPSAIQQLSLLAQSCNAVNLAEGFPDFPAPSHLKDAAIAAVTSDFNQYRHVQGICDLLASNLNTMHGLDVHPLTDVVITCGQSEAFAATMFAIINQGDEVILFDPAYETYETCIRLAGGVPVFVALHPPNWTFNSDNLIKSFTHKTKAIVLNRYRAVVYNISFLNASTFQRQLSYFSNPSFQWNSPHNPTGKVFSMDELEIIAEACKSRDILAVTDEVYEHITFDDAKHISLASLPEMQSRTIITSSLSKTYSVTGWRIGWAIAPACIASAIRNIHIRLTDSAPAPFQEAALIALRSSSDYFDSLKQDYKSRRDFVIEVLVKVGFVMNFKPKGSFFLFVKLPENCSLSDVDFVEELIKQAGVVAVPGCGFFHQNSSQDQDLSGAKTYTQKYIRFAFCKSDHTLAAAAEKILQQSNDFGLLKLF